MNFILMVSSVTEITMSLLLTEEELNCPIIGYNVIELFVKDNGPEKSLPTVTKNSNNADARAIAKFINGAVPEDLCAVKTSKKKFVIPGGQSVNYSSKQILNLNNETTRS